MSPAVRVALIGFTRFERDHIEAGLQPGGERDPVYVLADSLATCSVAVVNADHEASVAEVTRQGRLGSAVMLGTTLRPGAAVQLPRPLSLAPLLQALDALVQATPPMSAAVQRVHEDLARLVVRPRPAASPGGFMPVIEGRAAAAPAAPQPKQAVVDHVLIFDEDDAVLRFMAAHLERFGFEVHLVRSGAQAIESVARHHFAFVFLATGLEGADGFHICKTLKRRAYPGRRAPPTVVLLLEQEAAVNRLRAELAGADACLAKPLNAERLLSVVGAPEVNLQTDAQTTRASNSSWM